jgi:hypothetical protein
MTEPPSIASESDSATEVVKDSDLKGYELYRLLKKLAL